LGIVLKFNMIKKIAFCLLFFAQWSIAQESGYWDNVRTTNELITLKRNEKLVFKTADFPIGTTEIVFRITSVSDSQKISSSLVSVLKAIPDPTGISQGSAGAVLLASTISGDDKFKYAIFSSAKEAEAYAKNDKVINSCWQQKIAVTKEAKVLNASSSCFAKDIVNLWFVFETDNWFLNHKVQVEIVPWVDTKKSKGWTTANKQEVIALTKSLSIYPAIQKKEVFSGCFLEAITSTFTQNEFKLLLPQEKQQFIDKTCSSCLAQIKEQEAIVLALRNEVNQLRKNKKYNQAISIFEQKIIPSGKISALDYSDLGYLYLITHQYQKAKQALELGEGMDAANLLIQMNLAHVYMFTNQKSEAKSIHKKFAKENVNATESWRSKALKDISDFENLDFDKKILKAYKKILN
jgi:hypothetical protein